jgi:hypothetical protein
VGSKWKVGSIILSKVKSIKGDNQQAKKKHTTEKDCLNLGFEEGNKRVIPKRVTAETS